MPEMTPPAPSPVSYAAPRPATSTTATTAPVRKKPGWWWFLIGGLLIAAALTVAISGIVIGILRTSDQVDGFARFIAPATVKLDVTDTGTYHVYYEWRSSLEGRTFKTPDTSPPGLKIVVTDPDGQNVRVETASDSDVTFSINNREGFSVAKFRADRTGSYTLEATATTNDEFVLAVGPAVLGGLLAWILGGLGIGLLLFGGGLAIIIVAAVKRSRRSREARPRPGPPPEGSLATAAPGVAGPPASSWPPPRE
jgi:hypothetical protein